MDALRTFQTLCTSSRVFPVSRPTSRTNWSRSREQVREIRFFFFCNLLGCHSALAGHAFNGNPTKWFTDTQCLARTAPPSAIVAAIEATGRDAILRGSGSSNSKSTIMFPCFSWEHKFVPGHYRCHRGNLSPFGTSTGSCYCDTC